MPNRFAAPDTVHPVVLGDGKIHEGTVFLKPAIAHPRWEVGAYTYASSMSPPADWAARLAPYLFEFSPEMLRIGRFCQIADGVRFITASANHRRDGISTYPFAIFGGSDPDRPSLPKPGTAAFPDTEVGHDVWIGHGATILPGVRIGSGAIIGAQSVVTRHVAPYTVVAGNPATPMRQRFSTEHIARLQAIAWWDWDIDTIVSNEAAISGADMDALDRVARSRRG